MELQFIYNAKNNVASSIFDLAHKIISPETYQCNLCKITHSSFAENKKFKQLKEKFNITLWHIDDYEKKYNKEFSYPLIIIRDDEGSEQHRIETSTINMFQNFEELEEALNVPINSLPAIRKTYFR